MKMLFVLGSIGVCILFLGMLFLGPHYGVGFGVALMLACFSTLPLLKLNVAFSYATGWAAYPDTWKRPGGLHLVGWAIVGLLVFISCGLLYAGISTQEAQNLPSVDNAALLGGGALFSTLWSVLMWFVFWREQNRFMAEHEVRAMLKERGWKEQRINDHITNLRLRGLLAIEKE